MFKNITVLCLLLLSYNAVSQHRKENLKIAGLVSVNSLIEKMDNIDQINNDDKVVTLSAQTTFYIYEDRYVSHTYLVDGKELHCQRGIREAQLVPLSGEEILYEGEIYSSEVSDTVVLCVGEILAKGMAIRSEDFIDPITENNKSSTQVNVSLRSGEAFEFHMATIICLPGTAGKNQNTNPTFEQRKTSNYVTNGSSKLKVLFNNEEIRYHDETYFSGKKYAKATCSL